MLRTVSAIALAAGAHGADAEGRGSAEAAPSALLATWQVAPIIGALLLNGERAQPAGLVFRPQWDGLDQEQPQLHLNRRQR